MGIYVDGLRSVEDTGVRGENAEGAAGAAIAERERLLAHARALVGVTLAELADGLGLPVPVGRVRPSPANRYNVAIYTPYILKQISEMPRGANVVMSLGTNDAVAGLDEQQPRILQIVAAAREQGIKLTGSVRPACAPPGKSIPRSSTR